MKKKFNKTFYLNEKNIEALSEIKEKHNLNNNNELISFLLKIYKGHDEESKKYFREIKNIVEINTELLNALCLANNINKIDFTYKKGYSTPYNEAKKRLDEYKKDDIKKSREDKLFDDGFTL